MSGPRFEVYRQAPSPRCEDLAQFFLPLIKGVLVSSLHLEVLQDGTHERTNLHQRDGLASADHRALRERHEHVAIGRHFAGRDDVARR